MDTIYKCKIDRRIQLKKHVWSGSGAADSSAGRTPHAAAVCSAAAD
eukprot:COSAG01_NODE_63766_length_278_cov_18.932961_1_plen_45_part_01